MKTCNGLAVSSTSVLIFWDTDLALWVEHIMLFDLIFLLFLTNLVFKKSSFVWIFQTASPQGQHVFQPWKRAGTKSLTAKIFQKGTRESQWATWEDAVTGMGQLQRAEPCWTLRPSPSCGTWLLPTSKATELAVSNKLAIICTSKLNATPSNERKAMERNCAWCLRETSCVCNTKLL